MAQSALGFAASLALLLLVQRQIHRHLQGALYLITQNRQIALILYSILFFPGVLLHEGSHWMIAKMLRVPTRDFSLIPRRTNEGTIRFGYVATASVDPIRASLIGLAPLLAGAVALAILGLDHLGARLLAARLIAFDWSGAVVQLRAIVQTPDVLVWLYLIFAIGNTMLPSKSDRAAWAPALILLGAAVALMASLGVLDWAGHWLTSTVQSAVNNLTGIFLLTVVMDSLWLLPIILLELFVAKLIGQEIVYDS